MHICTDKLLRSSRSEGERNQERRRRALWEQICQQATHRAVKRSVDTLWVRAINIVHHPRRRQRTVSGETTSHSDLSYRSGFFS